MENRITDKEKATTQELIKAVKDICETISENILDWVDTCDMLEISHAKKRLPYLAGLLLEIYRRTEVAEQKFITGKDKEESSSRKDKQWQEE